MDYKKRFKGLPETKKKNLKYLTKKREELEEEISSCSMSDVRKLKKLLSDWTEVNNVMQDVWGFEINSNNHASWRLPHCTCPKMDNDDFYPTMTYFTMGCPIHEILDDIIKKNKL